MKSINYILGLIVLLEVATTLIYSVFPFSRALYLSVLPNSFLFLIFITRLNKLEINLNYPFSFFVVLAITALAIRFMPFSTGAILVNISALLMILVYYSYIKELTNIDVNLKVLFNFILLVFILNTITSLVTNPSTVEYDHEVVNFFGYSFFRQSSLFLNGEITAFLYGCAYLIWAYL